MRFDSAAQHSLAEQIMARIWFIEEPQRLWSETCVYSLYYRLFYTISLCSLHMDLKACLDRCLWPTSLHSPVEVITSQDLTSNKFQHMDFGIDTNIQSIAVVLLSWVFYWMLVNVNNKACGKIVEYKRSWSEKILGWKQARCRRQLAEYFRKEGLLKRIKRMMGQSWLDFV